MRPKHYRKVISNDQHPGVSAIVPFSALFTTSAFSNCNNGNKG